MGTRTSSLTGLRNIGRTVVHRLEEIGITTQAQLAKAGSAGAYKKLARRHPGKHLPVCYYLYSLEGALQDRHWDDFSDAQKRALRRKAGLKD